MEEDDRGCSRHGRGRCRWDGRPRDEVGVSNDGVGKRVRKRLGKIALGLLESCQFVGDPR